MKNQIQLLPYPSLFEILVLETAVSHVLEQAIPEKRLVAVLEGSHDLASFDRPVVDRLGLEADEAKANHPLVVMVAIAFMIHDETLGGGDVLPVEDGRGGPILGNHLEGLAPKGYVDVARPLVGTGTDYQDVSGMAGINARLDGLLGLVPRSSRLGVRPIGVRNIEDVRLQTSGQAGKERHHRQAQENMR